MLTETCKAATFDHRRLTTDKCLEIHAGAKSAPGTRDDGDAQRRVALQLVEGVGDPFRESLVNRVFCLRTV